MSDTTANLEEKLFKTPSPETTEQPREPVRRIEADTEIQDNFLSRQQSFSERVSAVSGATPAQDPKKTQSSHSASTTCDPVVARSESPEASPLSGHPIGGETTTMVTQSTTAGMQSADSSEQSPEASNETMFPESQSSEETRVNTALLDKTNRVISLATPEQKQDLLNFLNGMDLATKKKIESLLQKPTPASSGSSCEGSRRLPSMGEVQSAPSAAATTFDCPNNGGAHFKKKATCKEPEGTSMGLSGDHPDQAKFLQPVGAVDSPNISEESEFSGITPPSSHIDGTTSVVAQPTTGNSTSGDTTVIAQPTTGNSTSGDTTVIAQPTTGNSTSGDTTVIAQPTTGNSTSGDTTVIAQPTTGNSTSGDTTVIAQPTTETDYGQENAPILTGNGVIYESTNNNRTTVPSLPEAVKIPHSSDYNIAGGTTHKAQRTNSNSTQETNAQSEESDETSHSDRIGNMIRLLFSKEITHAIENLFIHSKELELQNELRDIINQCKKIMFEDPHLNLKVFYSIAMQMYRQGKETKFCPVCLKRKEDRVNNKEESPPKSHIFPDKMLEEFREIHCEFQLYQFIYNQISQKYKTCKNLTCQLFCQKCETSASAEERLLHQAYLRIAGAKDNTVYMSEEDGLKVKHILAVILFRTMLLGVDILDEYNDKFWSTLYSLRKLCCNTNAEGYKYHPLLEDFHVFILANQTYYNNENVTFSDVLDFQLRNPQLARMVNIDNDKVFLHNKFDVFHCILTIHWSDDGIKLDPKKPFHTFPEFLWKHYLSRIGSICQYILTLKKPCRAFLLDPLVRIATSEPLTSLKLPPSVHIDLTRSNDPRSALDEDNNVDLREIARGKSSIAQIVNSRLEKNCNSILSEKDQLKSHFTQIKNRTKKFRQASEQSLTKLNERCGKLEKRIKQLEERIKQLENTIDTLKHISYPSYQSSYKDLHPYQSDSLDSV